MAIFYLVGIISLGIVVYIVSNLIAISRIRMKLNI